MCRTVAGCRYALAFNVRLVVVFQPTRGGGKVGIWLGTRNVSLLCCKKRFSGRTPFSASPGLRVVGEAHLITVIGMRTKAI